MSQRLEPVHDRWGQADPYERYVGRWSRRVAAEFLPWVSVGPGADWADIGCGTGALTQCILREGHPTSVVAVDSSSGFVGTALKNIQEPCVRFQVADATALPLKDASVDVAVSGLVLNFVTKPAAMVAEMVRINRPRGQVAAYVWDYAGGMQMMRYFWDAAVEVAGRVEVPDEASRFPVCAPDPLRSLWQAAGLAHIEVCSIEIPTTFTDFNDYWQPFLGGQGAAPTWLAGQIPAQQHAIRELLHHKLPIQPDGSIELRAAAWAIKGTVSY